MVPVLLAPPPWANADALKDSATNKARRPVVQRLMLSSSSGVKNRTPQTTQINDNTDTDDVQMSPDVTAKDTAERGELQEIRAERSFRGTGVGLGGLGAWGPGGLGAWGLGGLGAWGPGGLGAWGLEGLSS